MQWPQHAPLAEVGPLKLTPGELVRGSLDTGVAKIALLACAGMAPGPVLYVQALQHGLELNGCEVMHRLIREFDPKALKGTLILVPMANPLAARVHMQSFPYPDRALHRGINDMNRRWLPPTGGPNHVDQMVAALAPIVALGDVIVDLHCHEYLYPCMAMTDMSIPAGAKLAVDMGIEVVRSGQGVTGMFGPYCRNTLGKVSLTVEMPPLRRVDAANAAVGLRSVRNTMRSMGMLDEALERPARTVIYGTKPQQGQSVAAEREGFMSRHVMPGDAVTEGQLLAEIISPDDFSVVQEIRSSLNGFVISLGRPPQAWGDPEHDFMNIDDRAAMVSTASEVIEW
jgi:uncharacterized protein